MDNFSEKKRGAYTWGKTVLVEDPGRHVLQVDLSNAFNTVDKAAIHNVIIERFPELQSWFEFTHGRPSPLFCGENIIYSEQGTQQGDPLGPAFFALAIQPCIEALHSSFNADWEAWYHDDGILVGDSKTLIEMLEHLQTSFRRLGLTVNLDKCKLWSPNGLREDTSPLPISDWGTPQVVLGTPFGSQEAVRVFLGQVRAKHHRALELLAKFPDPQIAVALLRHCLGAQKVNHLMRVMLSEDFSDFVDDTTEDIKGTLEEILGSHLPDATWLQSCLPIRLGGLGVQNPKFTHLAAFLSSSLAEITGAFSAVGEETPPDVAFWSTVSQLIVQLGNDDTLSSWQASRSLPDGAVILVQKLHEQKI